jgi:hypothetical protein
VIPASHGLEQELLHASKAWELPLSARVNRRNIIHHLKFNNRINKNVVYTVEKMNNLKQTVVKSSTKSQFAIKIEISIVYNLDK